MSVVNITASLMGAHFEPSVAVSVLNPNIINVIATDTTLGPTQIGIYRSVDGGATFSTGVLPLPVGFAGAEAPTIEYIFSNTFLVGMHAFNDIQDGSIFVYRSTDNGATFSDPILVTRGYGTVVHNDIPYMAADRSPSSPFFGHIYMTYVPQFDFEFGNGNSSIFFRCSLDTGLTWEAPIRISFPFGIQSRASITVGLAGEVYVSWIMTGPESPTYFIRRSLNGGVTFDPGISKIPAKISNVTLVPNQLPGYTFRVLTLASLGTDISASLFRGNIYAVWQDNRRGYSDILLSTSQDGLLWSAPQSITGSPIGSQNFFPYVTVSPFTGKVFVIYYTNRVDGHLLDTFVAESVDGSASFSNRRVTQTSFDPGSQPLIGDYITASVIKSQTLASVWAATVSGKLDVFLEHDNKAAGPAAFSYFSYASKQLKYLKMDLNTIFINFLQIMNSMLLLPLSMNWCSTSQVQARSPFPYGILMLLKAADCSVPGSF
ncbi:sialidase family protein [Paenibacillus alginolyticus]|uniref:Glycoside hydrolase n=1 Tax=Paenibacillus alginolyticus TaxID=59839 RepID=A0ABT4GDV9_9BACL|nr:sialidase family protein [Paenibacillus alginolyticus]MCY9694362.1 glycoside hydrolase [Paenibacillus alginolyticus]MEC0147531.1 sialidase family protein [Paenibacillus alginolyticus]